MWETPFDESMLSDPRGVIVLCNSAEDAADLERILIAHGGTDYPGTLEGRYNMCIHKHPDQDVCFRILDSRIAENTNRWTSVSVGYCHRSYYEKDEDGEFYSYIKCTFYGCADSDFDVADNDEIRAVLGI